MRLFLQPLAVVASCVLGVSALAACGGSTAASNDAGIITLDTGLIHIDAGRHDTGSGTGHDAGAHDTGSGDTGGGGPPEAGNSPDAEATYPGFIITAPQVVTGRGPVLSNPVFIPVFFGTDPYAAQAQAFLAAVGSSSYWMQAVSEYGVGAATMGTPIFLDETMPGTIDDSVVQTWLANKVGIDPRFQAIPGDDAGGAFDAGSVDATAPLSGAINQSARAPTNAIYVLYFPEGTTLTLSSGFGGGGGKTSSCGNGFGGYHNNFRMPNGSNVTYAMIPRCDSYAGFNGFDVLTATGSHELAEASTDPEVQTAPAYYTVDTEHFIWEYALGGGEVGDMCAQFPQAFYHPSEAALSSYTVQRIWSNVSAAMGQDPCRPALTGEVYFNTYPRVSVVNATLQGQDIGMYGTTIPVGSQAVVELDLFSTAAISPWTVQAQDLGFLSGGGANLGLLISPSSGSNGQKLKLTISALQAGQDGLSPYFLYSVNGDLQNIWVGLVVND